MSEYWDASQNADWDKAALYIHPDSLKAFSNVPRTRVIKWVIKSLGCNPEYTACDTLTMVTKPLPGVGAEMDWPLRNQWVLENGEWYFKIPWGENENPLFGAFKSQAAVTASAPTQEPAAAEQPAAGHSPVLMVEASQRLIPDGANPTVVHFGEKATFRYSFRNTGTKPVRIISADVDCHCTSVVGEYPEVPPGQMGSLEVVLDTFGLPLGPITKDLKIEFSDLSFPVVLPIRVSNLPNFKIDPPRVDFGTVEKAGTAEKSVRIVNESGRSVKILSQLKSDPRLECALDRSSLEAGESLTISLRYSPAAEGEFLDNLMIETDLAPQPLINIPVTGLAR